MVIRRNSGLNLWRIVADADPTESKSNTVYRLNEGVSTYWEWMVKTEKWSSPITYRKPTARTAQQRRENREPR